MATTVAKVIDALPTTGELRLFGGAARSALLVELLTRHTGRRVVTGPTEAAALGNALTQGVALGIYASQDAARVALIDESEGA
jgi:rhamnulokinase